MHPTLQPFPLPSDRQLAEFQDALSDSLFVLEQRGQRATAYRLNKLLLWIQELGPRGMARTEDHVHAMHEVDRCGRGTRPPTFRAEAVQDSA